MRVINLLPVPAHIYGANGVYIHTVQPCGERLPQPFAQGVVYICEPYFLPRSMRGRRDLIQPGQPIPDDDWRPTDMVAIVREKR
jgi:hypothetical protein